MSKPGYSGLTVLLHWVVAIAILFLFGISWWMMAIPYGEYRYLPFQLHKNLGMTLIALGLVLLIARFFPRPGALPPSTPRWMRRAAVADHVLMYLLIFVVCLSGMLSSAFSGWGTVLWWQVVLIPDEAARRWENEWLNTLFSDVHIYSSWILLALLITHVAGAVFHAFRRDGVARRMLRL
ncbi:MAG: cytochrome b [Gammaproteobacteria bacterium]|nr:cytochrome b [Gammaproteobacteria bacterium]